MQMSNENRNQAKAPKQHSNEPCTPFLSKHVMFELLIGAGLNSSFVLMLVSGGLVLLKLYIDIVRI